MKDIIFISLAPVFIIAFYIYYRDKWEKEPIGLLIASLLSGAVIVIPVILVETFLQASPFFDISSAYSAATYNGFIVAGTTEELFKLSMFLILIWGNKNFNEKFDGIVYAVFISLGFAGIENLIYVFNYGINIGYIRAFTAVPAHAIFGVIMGYHLGLAKMNNSGRTYHFFMAIILPILFHGFYDWIVMINQPWYLLLFIPYIFFLWRRAFRRIKELSDNSRFRNSH